MRNVVHGVQHQNKADIDAMITETAFCDYDDYDDMLVSYVGDWQMDNKGRISLMADAKFCAVWDHETGYITVVISPVTTWCYPCSPCYPGAGDLQSPGDGPLLAYDLPEEYYYRS